MERKLKDLLVKCADAYANTDSYYELSEEDETLMEQLGLPYAAGTSVTDEIYDQIERKAKFPAVVGAPVRGDKVKLPILMGSMTELHDGELPSFISGDHTGFCISTKLDGVSCLLEYHNGDFARAYSRGDGFEGQDITRHLVAMHNAREDAFPAHFDDASKVCYIRGEIIIPKKDIQACLDALYEESGKTYKNSRNTCAGQLNADVCYKAFAKYAHFVAYAVTFHNKTPLTTEEEKFAKLREWKFETAQSFLVPPEFVTQENMITVVQGVREKYEYECDGIIITQNDNQDKGVEANGLNPKCSRKFKMGATENVGEAIVKGVEWRPSKDALLIPRINLEPITLCGVEITWATGHNFKSVMDMHLHEGVKVRLKRAGDVIPYIEGVIEDPVPNEVLYQEYENPVNHDKFYVVPVTVIDNAGEQQMNAEVAYVKGVDLELDRAKAKPTTLKECLVQQMVNFGVVLEVDYLGEGNARAFVYDLYDQIQTTERGCIANLITKPVEWMYDKIGENGRKLYESLHSALKNASPSMFYAAVNCFGAGIAVKKLDKLWNKYQTFDLTKEQIVAVDGWGEKTAEQLIKWRPMYIAWENLLRMEGICLKTTKEEPESDKYKDYVVVFTGVRSKQMEILIQKNGGKIVSTCTKDCNLVVAEDPNGSSTKLNKAREKGVKIVSLMEAMDIFKE